MAFPVVNVNAWPVHDYEQIGDDRKEWLRAPDARLWLFKPRTERPDRVQGEDWCEKVAAEIAELLGVPHAVIELAERSGSRGCLSLDVKPDGWGLQTGAVLISAVRPGFVSRSQDRTGHNLETIRAALEGYGAPPGAPLSDGFSAFDVFAGFLVLDAIIANQDRHEENWAAVLPDSGQKAAGALAPSFDHGSSLGFGLTDTYRERWLDPRKLSQWAERGRAERFEAPPDGKRLTLVHLAARVLGLVRDDVRRHWLERVAALDLGSVDALVSAVPRLSDVSCTFTTKLIATNRRRVLDEC